MRMSAPVPMSRTAAVLTHKATVNVAGSWQVSYRDQVVPWRRANLYRVVAVLGPLSSPLLAYRMPVGF